MEESLKDARLIHRILIGVAAILCVFSLSSPSNVNFGPPKRALRCLQTIDLKPLREDIDKALVLELNKMGFYQALQNYNSDSPPMPLTPKQFDWNQYEGIDQGTTVLRTGSVVKVAEYVSKPQTITVFLPEMRVLFAALRRERGKLEQYKEEMRDTLHIKISRSTNRPELGYSASLNWADPDPFQASQGIGRWEDLGHNYPGIEAPLGLDVSGWMNLQCGNTKFTTEVHEVWDDIRDDDLPRAILRLEGMESRTARSVEITSLHIPSALVPVAGPLVLWFLLLSLLSHVRHIGEISASDREMLKTFGWEPLYPSVTARILTFASIVLLPVIAVVLLMIYAPSLSRILWILALMPTILVVGTTVVLWIAFQQIRRSGPLIARDQKGPHIG